MDLGIVYHVENAPQFWAELHEILDVDSKEHLSRIDGALRTFISFCTQYHELYLQTSLQLEHACSMLLESDIFSWHSERLSEIILSTAATDTNPHCELIVHSALLIYGRRNPAFLRSKAKWRPILPILMDHVLTELDDDLGGNVDLGRGPANESGMGVPIEARLRSLAIGILYEVCRVQKFDVEDLRIVDDMFVERLFDLVELTRNVDDESLNYSVIKLIVALSEQFMVATVPNQLAEENVGRRKRDRKHGSNRIIEVLMRRMHSSNTFGENLIFMLNRASNTEEDLVMQLLLLKILYLLFTTPGTQNYFYTNDLRVLVDVFLRELVDLPEESEALRHTYLRVLNPLLTHTQLGETPYKTAQIRRTLQSLVSNGSMREITPTTRRLVDRCLNAEWCLKIQDELETMMPPAKPGYTDANTGVATLSSDSLTHLSSAAVPDDDILEPPKAPFRFMTLHKSVSAEVLQPTAVTDNGPLPPSREKQLISSVGDAPIHPASKHFRNATTGMPSSSTRALDASQKPSYRAPPAIPDGANKVRKKSFSQPTREEASSTMAIHRTSLPLNGSSKSGGNLSTIITSARRPSLGVADLPRDRKPPPPPPIPVLDRASLDAGRPPRVTSSQPLIHRREPPAVPSKAKKPMSKGTISDSPLSKLAYTAATAAR